MRSTLLTVAVAVALASPAAAETLGRDARILSVEIDGTIFEPSDALLHLVGLDVGGRLDDVTRARLADRFERAGYVTRQMRFEAVAATTAGVEGGVAIYLTLDPVLVARAHVSGPTVESEATLIQFFGLQPGAHLRRDRVMDGIQKLGYFGEPRYGGSPTRVVVELKLEPARVVRHIDVHGSWPVFTDDIRRRLSLRPGDRLPSEEKLGARLREEAEHVTTFLHHEGYFESAVLVTVKPGGRPEWVDLDLRLQLGRWARVGDVVPVWSEKELDPPLECDPERDRAAEHAASERTPHAQMSENINPPEHHSGVCPEGFDCRPIGKGWECRRERALTDGDLKSKFTPRVYRPYWFGRFRLDQMRDDARSAEQLARDRGYPGARVTATAAVDAEGARVNVHPQVTQKGKVALHFSGNHVFSEKELLAKTTIFTAGSYDEVEVQASARELRRLYQQNGYLEAVITPRTRRVEKADVDDASRARAEKSPDREITFLIDEGPELRVRTVEITPEPGTGDFPIDLTPLRSQLATKVYPRFGALGLGEGGYLTDQQLAQDVDRIAAWFRGFGFPDPRVRAEAVRDPVAFDQVGVLGADVAARTGENDDLFVRFYVDPGRRESVERVEFRFLGTHGRTKEDLSSAMHLGAGATYSNSALTEDLERIKRLYTGAGRPYVIIDAREVAPSAHGGSGTTWNAGHTRVTLVVKVTEGPEVRFGPVLIRGNFKTRDSVILSDLPFKTGDLFDVNKIAIAEANLNSHNLFNGPRVTPYGLSERANPVPILVEVQERFDDWGTPIVTAGYSTDVGLSESLGYLWSNVFGGGGTIELRGEAAEDFTQVGDANDFYGAFWRLLQASLRYTHPHLLVPSLRGEIQAVARKEFTIRLGEVDTLGASLTLSWIASTRFRLFGRYDFTYSSLRNVDFQRLPGRNDAMTSVEDLTTTNKLTLGAVFDDRVSFEGAKNPLLPIEGWLLGGTVAGAAALGPHGHNFLVYSGQVQRYQPLGRGCLGRSEHPCTSLIANFRGDWGMPIGESALPAVERFFAGGDNTTRGFDTDMMKTEIIRGDVSPAPPTGSRANDPPVAYRIIPQGGNIRFLGTVEFQFPISQFGGYPWMGALFFDAGTIFDRPQSFDASSDLKASVGVSLFRILTPVGPLSLEYAYPLTQSLAEEQWAHETSWYLHWPGRIHFNWGIPILR